MGQSSGSVQKCKHFRHAGSETYSGDIAGYFDGHDCIINCAGLHSDRVARPGWSET